MHSKSLLAFTLYVIGIQQALAAPVITNDEVAPSDLEVRSSHTSTPKGNSNAVTPGSSSSHPIEAKMSVNANNALPFDADCYAILCGGVDPLFKRDGTESDDNRDDSGALKSFPGNAKKGPFKNTQAADVKIPGATYVSAEEFPFASTLEGGNGAFLFPVTEASQKSQGGTINGFYTKNKIADKDYFRITGWTGTVGPYCEALEKAGGKPQTSNAVCQKGHAAKGTWGFDIAEYAYKYDGHSYRAAGKNK